MLRQRPYATIQACDEPEGTIYTLCRPGLPPVGAHWPHYLLEICPEAVRIPTLSIWGRGGLIDTDD